MRYVSLFVVLLTGQALLGQGWTPDNGDGTYQNPVLHADYSDPDVIRYGDDFYLVSSSFNCTPGLPLLHSKDLVNWNIINNILPVLPPEYVFATPQHGNGVWAPSIRYHDGWFYVFYGDPDFGIYMCKTQDPLKKWEEPRLVRSAKGWIDPCPFWDADGNAYLVHAFAGSRAGIKSILVLHAMAPDGSQLLDDGVLIFDGHADHSTIEGPKMYKRNGYYYVFAPAGGVATGWQTILRSKNIYGPYEGKIVLHQGETDINGPHQGAWVELENGENWFLHFQEKQPYGRIVHLQPMQWNYDWPVIGEDADHDGIGEPVLTHIKPGVGAHTMVTLPQTSDEFNTTSLGLQWQWHANPRPEWAYTSTMGYLRLNPVIMDANANLWQAPNLLLQKMPAETFMATTKVSFHHHFDSEKTGLIVMGLDYAYIALEREDNVCYLVQRVCQNADDGTPETVISKTPLSGTTAELRVSVAAGGVCQFSYRTDSGTFTDVGAPFQSREGKWIGAKVGLFCVRNVHQNDGGYADYDWFRIEKL